MNIIRLGVVILISAFSVFGCLLVSVIGEQATKLAAFAQSIIAVPVVFIAIGFVLILLGRNKP